MGERYDLFMNKNLSTDIMDKVKKYETRRTGKWLVKWLVVIGSLVVGSVIVLYLAIAEFYDLGTWDLVGELGDNWQLVWEELPKERLVASLVGVMMVGLIVWLLRGKIRVVINKIRYLSK